MIMQDFYPKINIRCTLTIAKRTLPAIKCRNAIKQNINSKRINFNVIFRIQNTYL